MTRKHSIPLTRGQLAGSLVWGVIALLFGWTLFAYWWREVLQQDPPRSLVVLGLSVVLVCAVLLLATLVWIWHNLRLARRGSRGRATRYHTREFLHDALGRPIVLPDGDEVQRANIVDITADAERKIYAPRRAAPG